MKFQGLLYSSVLMTLMIAPAIAQTAPAGTTTPPAPATTTNPVPVTGTTALPPSTSADPNAFQRNVYQQDRIEQGLDSGELSTGEAGHLEKGEAHIDQMESHDEKTGMTPQEMQNLERAQNNESNTINKLDDNNIHGNPDSASSQRMQTDVQRDANQQSRINQGVDSGSLTANETRHLEHGQAHDDRSQAAAARNGHVSAREQARLQREENRQSRHIYRKKHNNYTGKPNNTAQ